MSDSFEAQRKEMVEDLRKQGITDKKVLAAFEAVPRHEFIPQGYRDQSYEDHPVPIGSGQTISQPYMVALITEELRLKPSDTVLEIGSGSGYQAAILSLLAKKVYAIERVRSLADTSRKTLAHLGYANIEVIHADGTEGLLKHAPFDRIIVSAQADEVPKALLDQLRDGGIMVIPLGGRWQQELTKISRSGEDYHYEHLVGCVFVPFKRGCIN